MSIDLNALSPKLVDLLLDPVFVVDQDGLIVFVSTACETLLGYSRQEMTGSRIMDYVHPEDRARTQAAAARIIEGSSHLDFENRYVGKDGRIVHIMWSARWSETDRVRIAVARDVTALKHAEKVRCALYRISEAAHSADSLLILCREIHQVIGDLLPADRFYVALHDDTDQTVSFPYFADDRHPPRDAAPLKAASAIADVIRSGKALLAARGDVHPEFGTKSASMMEGNADWLGVPLVSGDRIIGAVVIVSASAHDRYSAKERDLLQFVSTQMATVIERKRAEEQLRHMAVHDALTGLPNRILFHDRLEMAIRRARRDSEFLGVLYLDLDNLKTVNDTLGHEAGDRLLREVAKRLLSCTRASDTVARMGGDEFTVLLANLNRPESVDVVIEKIKAALVTPLTLPGNTLPVSVSIGSAVFPDHGETAAILLRHADADMYEMKQRTRLGSRASMGQLQGSGSI